MQTQQIKAGSLLVSTLAPDLKMEAMCQNADGTWHCKWIDNANVPQYADFHPDVLYHWGERPLYSWA